MSDEDRTWLLGLVDTVQAYGKEEPPEPPKPREQWRPPTFTFQSDLDARPAPADEAEPVAGEPELEPVGSDSGPKPKVRAAIVNAQRKRDLVLETLRSANGPIRITEIRDRVADQGVTGTDVGNALNTLRLDGLASSIERGVWALVGPGDNDQAALEASPELADAEPEPTGDAQEEPARNSLLNLPDWRKDLEETARQTAARTLEETYGPVVDALPTVHRSVACERCEEVSDRVCPDYYGGRLSSTHDCCRRHSLHFCQANRLTIVKARAFAEDWNGRLQDVAGGGGPLKGSGMPADLEWAQQA